MSAHWSVLFDETLAGYVQKYMEAYGNPIARARILKNCREDITKSPLHEERDIELPQHLYWAICKEFLPYLDDDDSKEEEAKLVRLEKGGEYITPEEREAAARPTDAGDYWKEWDAFRVAQRLFPDEVADIDNASRDKTDKKAFGNRTSALRKWFKELPTSKEEEVKAAAAKWNLEGAPDKDKMSIYRKKNLGKRTTKLIEALRRTMGVHCVVLQGYVGGSTVKTVLAETKAYRGKERQFSVSSNECKTWTLTGSNLLTDYMADSNDASEEKDSSDGEEVDVPAVQVDELGHPILPTRHIVNLKSRQDVVRDIFTKAYMRITKRDNVHVPWLELARAPTTYLDSDTIPEGFKILDPSKLTKDMIFVLWSHWSGRARAKLPILIFIKSRDPELWAFANNSETEETRKRITKKRIAYVDVESDDQTSDNELDGHTGTDKGEGASGSTIRPPPSKRLRLSQQPEPALPEEQSPAANNSDRLKFLCSLSVESSYKTLLDGVSALPALASCQSSSQAVLKSKLSLPVWSSWDWDQKYLPPDIHTRWADFNEQLDLLLKYKFADRDEGILVVLGFGLLLRECWRAVEVEDDDEHSPTFLGESLLTKKRIDKVTKGIREVIGRPLSQNTIEERPSDRELDGGAKGQKAKAGLKKPTTKSSPVRNIRSQRQRKPSKKLRDSD